MSASLEHKLDQMREGVWRLGLFVTPVEGGKRFSVKVEQLCLFNLTKNDCLHQPISSLKCFFFFIRKNRIKSAMVCSPFCCTKLFGTCESWCHTLFAQTLIRCSLGGTTGAVFAQHVSSCFCRVFAGLPGVNASPSACLSTR